MKNKILNRVKEENTVKQYYSNVKALEYREHKIQDKLDVDFMALLVSYSETELDEFYQRVVSEKNEYADTIKNVISNIKKMQKNSYKQ